MHSTAEAREGNGATPLFAAAQPGLGLLMDGGADADKASDGRAPVFKAVLTFCDCCSRDALKWQTPNSRNGASVGMAIAVATSNGRTPVHVTANDNGAAAAQMLLSMGTDHILRCLPT